MLIMENSTREIELLKNYIIGMKKGLDKSLVATPTTREDLERFAGSGTFVAVQMAIQFGYKMALESVEEKLK